MNRKRRTIRSKPLGLSTFSRLRLRVALFLCGASVMAVGILGTRIIVPHFGAGVFVWTSLITVAMVALTLGYWLGGKLADRRPSSLLLSGILLTAAATITLIPVLRAPVLDSAWDFGLRTGSIFTVTALFFPSLFLLGMISPFTVRLEADGFAHAGSSAGRLHAICQLGSVMGAVLTGFLLLPWYRMPTVFAIVASTLVFAGLLAATPGLKKRVLGVGSAVVFGGIFLASPPLVRRHYSPHIPVTAAISG